MTIMTAAPRHTVDRTLPVYLKVDASMHDGWGYFVLQFDRDSFHGQPTSARLPECRVDQAADAVPPC